MNSKICIASIISLICFVNSPTFFASPIDSELNEIAQQAKFHRVRVVWNTEVIGNKSIGKSTLLRLLGIWSGEKLSDSDLRHYRDKLANLKWAGISGTINIAPEEQYSCYFTVTVHICESFYTPAIMAIVNWLLRQDLLRL